MLIFGAWLGERVGATVWLPRVGAERLLTASTDVTLALRDNQSANSPQTRLMSPEFGLSFGHVRRRSSESSEVHPAAVPVHVQCVRLRTLITGLAVV